MKNSERNQNVVKYVDILINTLGMKFYSIGLRMNHERGLWEAWATMPGTHGGWKEGKVADYEKVEDAVDFQELVRQNLTRR